jgi:hypothetical protein
VSVRWAPAGRRRHRSTCAARGHRGDLDPSGHPHRAAAHREGATMTDPSFYTARGVSLSASSLGVPPARALVDVCPLLYACQRRARSWAFSWPANPRSPARVGGPRSSASRDPAGSSYPLGQVDGVDAGLAVGRERDPEDLDSRATLRRAAIGLLMIYALNKSLLHCMTRARRSCQRPPWPGRPRRGGGGRHDRSGCSVEAGDDLHPVRRVQRICLFLAHGLQRHREE